MKTMFLRAKHKILKFLKNIYNTFLTLKIANKTVPISNTINKN